ncbi:MAG: TIGR04282 family arsenosugar biosynthesis glycosyltransferase [Halioglobus sp.]
MATDRLDTVFIQFAKAPVPGKVKTRLLPALTAQAACDLHCDLVRHTAGILLGSGLGDVQIWVDDDLDNALFQELLTLGVSAGFIQQGEDLGERMQAALAVNLDEYDAAVLVGSDCPGLSPEYLQDALLALGKAELVVGPALDGGYVLLAMRREFPWLFTQMKWGGDDVLAETLKRAEKHGVNVRLLKPLADIDRPEDLQHWHSVQRSG